ncbi:PAS domain-containing protein [Myxococcota bacterium]|nr:PAS domain-containing protein [Myxococcota bacterium]MBU1536010.1 PAS domain-containing protein [Myxococcota bacterium]
METKMLSHNEYMNLVEQAPIMIWRANLSAECDYFNAQWLLFTGRTMEQEVGNGWAEGVHPEDFDKCLEIYLTAFKQQKSFEMEYRLRRHDGEYRWIFDRGVPFFTEENVFAGYIGSCIDIMDTVEARKILFEKQQSEIEQLRRMLPICASCKKIRDDKGYWNRIEVYFQERSDINFTHGICPDCIDKLYPEMNE